MPLDLNALTADMLAKLKAQLGDYDEAMWGKMLDAIATGVSDAVKTEVDANGGGGGNNGGTSGGRDGGTGNPNTFTNFAGAGGGGERPLPSRDIKARQEEIEIDPESLVINEEDILMEASFK